MHWARMRWSPHALGTRKELWFGHGCCGVTICSWNKNVIVVWAWMRWPQERLYGLGMDAAGWPCAPGTRTSFWFGHGCAGHKNVFMVWAWMLRGDRMLLEQERHYGLGMDAQVTVCPRNTSVIMLCSGYHLEHTNSEIEMCFQLSFPLKP